MHAQTDPCFLRGGPHAAHPAVPHLAQAIVFGSDGLEFGVDFPVAFQCLLGAGIVQQECETAEYT